MNILLAQKDYQQQENQDSKHPTTLPSQPPDQCTQLGSRQIVHQ